MQGTFNIAVIEVPQTSKTTLQAYPLTDHKLGGHKQANPTQPPSTLQPNRSEDPRATPLRRRNLVPQQALAESPDLPSAKRPKSPPTPKAHHHLSILNRWHPKHHANLPAQSKPHPNNNHAIRQCQPLKTSRHPQNISHQSTASQTLSHPAPRILHQPPQRRRILHQPSQHARNPQQPS